MADAPYKVLFLCTGNSARSIMAEAILNRLGGGRFKAFSAGSEPTGRVNPFALELLADLNYPITELRSKSWDEFSAPGTGSFDFVLTLCDSAKNEACPVWWGQPTTAHWGLPDPAVEIGCDALTRAAFADTYRILNARIGMFTSQPIGWLDKASLQRLLCEIGKTAFDVKMQET